MLEDVNSNLMTLYKYMQQEIIQVKGKLKAILRHNIYSGCKKEDF